MLLTKAGREVLLSGYERRMLQQTKGALPGMSGSLRRHLDRPVMALTHVIAYDIGEDNRRAHVAAILQAHGDRVQRSVFVCTIEPDILHELCDRISQAINPRTD